MSYLVQPFHIGVENESSSSYPHSNSYSEPFLSMPQPSYWHPQQQPPPPLHLNVHPASTVPILTGSTMKGIPVRNGINPVHNQHSYYNHYSQHNYYNHHPQFDSLSHYHNPTSSSSSTTTTAKTTSAQTILAKSIKEERSPLLSSRPLDLRDNMKTLNLCMEKSFHSRKQMLSIRNQFLLFLEEHPHLYPVYIQHRDVLRSQFEMQKKVLLGLKCSDTHRTRSGCSITSTITANTAATIRRRSSDIRMPQQMNTPLSSNASSGLAVSLSCSDEENIHPEEMQRRKRSFHMTQTTKNTTSSNKKANTNNMDTNMNHTNTHPFPSNHEPLYSNDNSHKNHSNSTTSPDDTWNTITDQHLGAHDAKFPDPTKKVEENDSLKSHQSYVSEGTFSLPELDVAGFMASKMDCGDTSTKFRSEGGSSAFHHLLDICSSEVSYNSSKTNPTKGGSGSGLKSHLNSSTFSHLEFSLFEVPIDHRGRSSHDTASLKLKSAKLSPSSIPNSQLSFSTLHSNNAQSLNKRLSWKKFDGTNDHDGNDVKKRTKFKVTKKTIRRRAPLDHLSTEEDEDASNPVRVNRFDTGSHHTKPESVRTLEIIKAVENIFENRSEVSFVVPSEDRWQPVHINETS